MRLHEQTLFMPNVQTPRNFIFASNLIFIVFILSIVYIFLPDIRLMASILYLNITMKVVLLGLAIFLRLGYTWVKYLLAVFAVLTLLGVRDVLDVFIHPSFSTILNVVQIILIAWATVVVFKKP